MQEDGVNSGYRNLGRFFLAAIPWILGLGAAVWLGVYIEGHNFRKQLSQEDRAAVYTGAAERPKEKLKIDTPHRGCATVTRVDVDGNNLLVYARNDCHSHMEYLEWKWQLLSPDGTVLRQGWENGGTCPTPADVGDQAECKMREFDTDDDRASTLRVWVKPFILHGD